MEASTQGFLTSAEALVKKTMHEPFVNRDVTAIERYWGTPYIQHNPEIPDGHEALPAIIQGLPESFSYEPGLIASRADTVMLHGRYVGWRPKPKVAVDIFRVANGKVVEHWDVLQDEVPAAQTKSGNATFAPGEK